MTSASRANRATVGGWLASRTPPPPEGLRSRIRAALGSAIEDDVRHTAHVCLDAAEGMLSRLVGAGGGDRHEAAALLAADALVTYALEFAADAPERFEEQATAAIARFGRLHQRQP